MAPDVLVLTDFDYDYDQLALQSFAQLTGYPHTFSRAPNSGVPTGLDLDRNGKVGEARDAQGYGRFTGDGGLAVLSQHAIETGAVTDLSDVLWRDLAGATLPDTLTAEVAAVQKLSSTAHWIVPVTAPDGQFDLLISAHTPPVFDGPEDRNGLRNQDEILLWQAVLDGTFGAPPTNVVFTANFNLDPFDGEGRRAKLLALLEDPRLQDPKPRSAGGAAAANPDHQGDPGLDTADWAETGPGNLRVSYVLPAATWEVVDAGVFWPTADDPQATLLGSDGRAAGPHHLVWVDIRR
ncbi:MAG: endonuclease/exonuclease/phosphatase family protein [Pseudomonadota bacterium]